MDKETIKKTVREKYGKITRGADSCSSPQTSCCGNKTSSFSPGKTCCGDNSGKLSELIGYSDQELATIPQESNLGLGCGNPLAFASIKKGDTVLDLGSGAGIDCFLAAGRVGSEGKVIGVDMTAEMLEKARENACKGGYNNVEFRLGEIENLPVADNCVDLIISNCVINLSTDKKRVFEESFRVLKPGGRLMVSDMVITKELPASIKNSVEAYIGCIAGAVLKEEYLAALESAGFTGVEVVKEQSFNVENWTEELGLNLDESSDPADLVFSISVSAIKEL